MRALWGLLLDLFWYAVVLILLALAVFAGVTAAQMRQSYFLGG